MSRILFVFTAIALLLTACKNDVPSDLVETPVEAATLPVKAGTWRLVMELSETQDLPFNVEITHDGENYSLQVINSEERIEVDNVQISGDSIYVRMPFFDSEFVGTISSDESFEGHWYNFTKGVDYKIPFYATYGKDFRFSSNDADQVPEIAGQWEVTFSPEDEWAYKAIGSFQQFGKHVTGTFITETGDYRYLDGISINDSLQLSCFDGSHAFLFKAAINENRELNGQFWSGNHWEEPWVASRNDDFELRDPDSLTYLKAGFNQFEFTFPDLDSNLVSLSDEKYDDKVVIIQIMGSWCPNCLDETSLYVELFNRYNNSGLEIVSLAFEASPEFSKASEDVRRLREKLNADYDFLIAGVANKKKASETLPMLNHVMSYPTSIFIDKKGQIRRVHTGFYGPGTGKYYAQYVEDITGFIEKMLAEEA